MLAAFSICLYGMHHFVAAVIALLGTNTHIYIRSWRIALFNSVRAALRGRHDAILWVVFRARRNVGKLMCARLKTTNRQKTTRAVNSAIMHVNASRLLRQDPRQEVRDENNLLR